MTVKSKKVRNSGEWVSEDESVKEWVREGLGVKGKRECE